MQNIVVNIIKKLKISYNNWLNVVYWLIEKLNKNKTSSQKQVEQTRLLSQILEIIKIKGYNFKYWNYVIIILWIILYLTSLLTIVRIKYFIIIIILIGIYKVLWEIMQKKIQNIKISEKVLYLILKLSVINNIILYIIGRLDLILYKKYLEKKINIMKHIINLLIPIKILYYYMYNILNNFRKLTIYEIIWKRMYGTILSVLIFTNIIQILIIECGGRLNLILFIYIVMVSLCYIEKEEKKEPKFYYLYNLDVLSIWKKRAEANMLYYYVEKQWQQKTWMEKLEFLKVYGSNINVECFYVLNVKSVEVFEVECYVKKKKNLNDAYFSEHIWWGGTIEIVKNLLKYENELEYLKLLYENKKYNKKLQIVKDHKVDALLSYNSIMIKALLYYIWDIISPANLEIVLDAEMDQGLKLLENDINLEKVVKQNNLNLSIENHRILYDIKLFSFLFDEEIGYIKYLYKYEMYINYFKFDNMTMSFKNKETNEILTCNFISDTVQVRINTIDVIEINEQWESLLNKKIIEYNIEYKKGLYLEYFKKLER